MGIYSDTDGYDKKQNGHRNEKSGCLSAANSSSNHTASSSSSAPLPLLNMSVPTFAISSLVFLLLATFASLQFYLPKAASSCLCPKMVGCGGHIIGDAARPYNASTIGRPKPLADGRVQYQIAVVSDLDHDSKFEGKKDTWRSFLRRGRLLFHPELQTVQVDWDHQQQQQEKGKGNAAGDSGGSTDSLYSQLSMGGRAMELSDLTVFDGRLLTVDDRTGVIYRIDNFKDMIPWVLLNDGPGNTTKGFKAEWTTVKDGHLFVGGLGKEWTTADGVFVNYHPMWIKVVNPSGEIVHVDWTENYKRLRRTVGIEFPGYMIHESAQWSDVHQKWFFLPRRASNDTYQEDEDEHRGTNLLLIASEDFSNIEVRHLGPKGDGSRGFSAFHFLPGSDDQILVALKSEEREGRAVASYLCMFRLADGQVLLEEQKFDGPYKYEGLILF